MKRSYKDDLKINLHALDKEWERQPDLYIHWAEEATNAIDLRDSLERQLTVWASKKAMRIRKNPKIYGLDKVTDSAIKDIINSSAEYNELYAEWLRAKKDASILDKVGSRAFEHKKRALEKITELYFNNYFSEPRIKKEVKDAVEEGKRFEHRKLLKSDKRIGGKSYAK